MEYAVLILLHVAGGLLWAGGAITAGFFVIPAVLEAGPAGGAVMAGVVKRGFPGVMTAAGGVVVLTGLRLYSLRFDVEWLANPEGLALTVGGLLGIGAMVIGQFLQKPLVMRIGALAGQIAAAGTPPTAEQAAELAALRTRLGKVARITAWHVLGASVLMAMHRLTTMM